MIKFLNNITHTTHLLIAFTLRLIVIVIGNWIDEFSEVPFTDIDYRVVTDGARHLLANRTPYTRHTYRYSPLLAYSLLPNILLYDSYGKILFSFCDIIIGHLIQTIVYQEYLIIWQENVIGIINANRRRKNYQPSTNESIMSLPQKYRDYAKWAAMTWLYNPLAIAVSTRGNGDSITATLVLLTIFILLTAKKQSHFFLAGLIHGLTIHFRLYPMAFSFAYYLYLTNNHRDGIIKIIFWPNWRQILLVTGTITSLAGLTCFFYQQYGYQFLYETYIYHFTRKDTRHNFSLYFYMYYLSTASSSAVIGNDIIVLLEKCLIVMPQLIILLLLAIHFGRHRRTLPFCIFAHSFTLVSYNTVITSQYFIWFLTLLPLCWHNLRKINIRTAIAYTLLWFLAQGAWLGPAYMLEFKGWNMFGLIWIQSVMLFAMNMFLLQRFILNFNVIADFRIKQF